MPNENKPSAAPTPMRYAVDLIPVESSNIRAVGWQQNQLFVEFHNGGQYRYANVGESVFHDMLAADSKGHFLADRIKGKYPYQKVAITNTHQSEGEGDEEE